jgi:NAD(P)-dependent dehydrogenase (short-subunit alcohol dehydrogenase family)
MRPLQGRHAVVTGGGTGIGLAVARALAGLGAAVTVMGRRAEPLAAAVEALRAADGEAQAVPCDVTDEGRVNRAFVQARAGLGPVSVLVNNAGAARSAPFLKTGPELWGEMLAVNLTGAFLCTRAALPDMLEAGFGRVVSVASTAGLAGYPYVAAYCAAKHGLVGMTRALALETARTGVTVNAVCPGFTDTDLIADSVRTITAKTGRSAEEARGALAAHNPQGRLVTPGEVAEAVAWLCLPSSQSMTGQAIAVAGGEVMP